MRRHRFILLVGVLGVGMVGLALVGYARVRGVTQTRTWAPQDLAVEPPLRLVVHNPVGDVRIVGQPPSRVDLKAVAQVRDASRKRAQAVLADIHVQTRATEHELEITVTLPARPKVREAKVDLILAVPHATHVVVRQDVGQIRVSRLEGAMDLQLDVGEVQVREVAWQGPTVLRVNTGELDVQAALPNAGTVALHVGVGELHGRLSASQEPYLTAAVEVGQVYLSLDGVQYTKSPLVVGSEQAPLHLDLGVEVGQIDLEIEASPSAPGGES